jgi:hypothetical protein
MSNQGLFIAVHRGSPKIRDIYRDPRIAGALECGAA